MPAAPPRQLRRLSSAEMAERRRQGLCYNCDEPYVQGHRCQRLFYLEVSDFDESEELDPEKDPENSELPPLISLHAITGIRPEETMQLRVNIGNHELTALLDSGSTHNFVSMEAARHIGLSFHDSKGKNVVIANGDRVACRGLARDVALCIAGSFFTVDSYTIPLDCYDMVLGVPFLRTLGSILWDFDDLCMAFWHHGQRLLWKRIGSTRWDIQPTGRLHSISSESSPLLNRLLESFHDMFEPPTALPQSWHCNHRIHLLPDTAPVAVRPYTYPQMQEEELESQCATMLKQGIIQPSTFQSLMNNVLHQFLRKSSGVVMDRDKVQAVAAWPVSTSPRAFRDNLVQAQSYAKIHYDAHLRQRKFAIGVWPAPSSSTHPAFSTTPWRLAYPRQVDRPCRCRSYMGKGGRLPCSIP